VLEFLVVYYPDLFTSEVINIVQTMPPRMPAATSSGTQLLNVVIFITFALPLLVSTSLSSVFACSFNLHIHGHGQYIHKLAPPPALAGSAGRDW
jgi:hypothetical protein